MPVTLKLVDHAAEPWRQSRVTDASTLLKASCPLESDRSERIIQSSFSFLEGDGQENNTHVSASENGFFWAALHAYSAHHHLTLRPEDIWFAILTQLSFYINAHAEELRSFFVDHQGQKTLSVVAGGTLASVDFGQLAQHMTDELAKNVRDAQLRDWVMPAFSTTTESDRVVAAVLFMGAMQRYFGYRIMLMCGLPSVTLLGERRDWEALLGKLDGVDALPGEEPAQFAAQLRPVLRRLVRSFDAPESADVRAFWAQMAHRELVPSGSDYVSGWLTAFCFWNQGGVAWRSTKANYQLDGVQYYTVNTDTVPPGVAAVPVTVDDHGCEFEATMVAGSVGISASRRADGGTRPAGDPGSGTGDGDDDGDDAASPLDTVQPLSGWWVYKNNEKAGAGAEEKGEHKAGESLSALEHSPSAGVDEGNPVEVMVVETPQEA